MGTIASPRNLYSYFRKGYIITDIAKRVFSAGFYYNSASYYKAVLGQYVNFSSYINIYNGTIKLNTIHTSADIQPDILGADARHVISKHGKPDFIFSEKNLLVYVYKWKFNGLKTRCEVHLHKNKAFLVNHIYNQLDKGERDYIVNAITCKYLDQYANQIGLGGSKISDQNNNVLFVDNFMMGLKISYLSSCECDWYEEMATFVNERKARQQEKANIGEMRFFNKI